MSLTSVGTMCRYRWLMKKYSLSTLKPWIRSSSSKGRQRSFRSSPVYISRWETVLNTMKRMCPPARIRSFPFGYQHAGVLSIPLVFKADMNSGSKMSRLIGMETAIRWRPYVPQTEKRPPPQRGRRRMFLIRRFAAGCAVRQPYITPARALRRRSASSALGEVGRGMRMPSPSVASWNSSGSMSLTTAVWTRALIIMMSMTA